MLALVAFAARGPFGDIRSKLVFPAMPILAGLTPNGSGFVSTSGDQVALWDIASRRPKWVRSVEQIASVSPDALRAVIQPEKGDLSVIELPSGRTLWKENPGSRWPGGFTFSRDHRLVAELLLPIDRATRSASEGIELSFSPEPTKQETVVLRDTDSGATLSRFQTPVPGCVAFSRDATKLALGVWNGLQLYDIASGHLDFWTSAGSGLVNRVIFSGDGTRLLGCSTNGNSYEWDAKSGQQLLEGKTDTWSEDGSAFGFDASHSPLAVTFDFVTGSRSPEIVELGAKRKLCQLVMDEDSEADDFTLAEDGANLFASVSTTDPFERPMGGDPPSSIPLGVREWDLSTGHPSNVFAINSGTRSEPVFNLEGDSLWLGGSNVNIDLRTGAMKNWSIPRSETTCISPDGSYVAYAQYDEENPESKTHIFVLDLTTGERKKLPKSEGMALMACAESARWLLVVGDGWIERVALGTGKVMGRFAAPKDDEDADEKASRDGTRLLWIHHIYNGSDETWRTKVFDTATGRVVANVERNESDDDVDRWSRHNVYSRWTTKDGKLGIDLFDRRRGRAVATICPLEHGWLVLDAEGHFDCSSLGDVRTIGIEDGGNLEYLDQAAPARRVKGLLGRILRG